MNKKDLVKLIESKLQSEYDKLKKIAEDQRALATADDMQQEGKYDTRRIEASYLAGAQAKRVTEVEIDLKLILTFEPRDFKKEEEVDLGAIVSVEDESGNQTSYFLTPCSGGMALDYNDKKVQMLSINSPLASDLLRLEVGDSVEFESPKGVKDLEVTDIS